MPKSLPRVVLGLCALAVGGCTGGGPPSGPPRVVATTGMIGDIVRGVAGGAVAVDVLMGPGVDPHLYKPTEGDVRRLGGAAIIFYNGLNLEGKMGSLFERMQTSRPVVAVAERLPADELLRSEAFQGHADPHVWFDARLWSGTVAPVEEHLSRLLPEHAAEFGARAEDLRARLVALDREVEESLSVLEPEQRVLVTAHDAFGYFGKRYGIDVIGLQGISTASEAGIDDVQRVVDLVVERRVRAVFVESSVPRRQLEAVREACRARGHEVRIGGELFSDAMGAAGSPEGTYFGMVRHNVRTIVAALE